MNNAAEAMTMRELAKNLFDKAEWHQKQATQPPPALGLAESYMEGVFNKLKAEIFADVARTADEIADVMEGFTWGNPAKPV